ncbi:MAG TPA: hypothetical protein PKN99_03080 [Cyclobacteriaceae bacterium]|nr:hypothetical protein [Cyclobacteriaceae bacterium]
MDSEVQIEVGWVFYVVIITLIAAILIEAVAKPLIARAKDKIYEMKMKTDRQKETIEKIKKWIKF